VPESWVPSSFFSSLRYPATAQHTRPPLRSRASRGKPQRRRRTSIRQIHGPICDRDDCAPPDAQHGGALMAAKHSDTATSQRATAPSACAPCFSSRNRKRTPALSARTRGPPDRPPPIASPSGSSRLPCRRRQNAPLITARASTGCRRPIRTGSAIIANSGKPERAQHAGSAALPRRPPPMAKQGQSRLGPWSTTPVTGARLWSVPHHAGPTAAQGHEDRAAR